MSKLPYANSKANPIQAQARIRQMRLKCGVDLLRFSEDMQKHEIKVEFVYKGYPVSLPINIDRLAARYLKDDPWDYRKRSNRQEWEANKRYVASSAAFSLLEDFLKGLIMVVELGIFSFEEIFVAYFMDNKGRRLGEIFTKRLPDLVSGRLSLSEGAIVDGEIVE